MTNEMNMFLIAQALIPSENAEYLIWIFEQVFSHQQMKLIEINDAIFDHGRFHPKIILTDGASDFALALELMCELWPEMRHLLCRWHVYEAIRRYVTKIF